MTPLPLQIPDTPDHTGVKGLNRPQLCPTRKFDAGVKAQADPLGKNCKNGLKKVALPGCCPSGPAGPRASTKPLFYGQQPKHATFSAHFSKG